MAGDTQKEISKKLDQKVKQMELGEVLGKMIRTTKQFGDKIQKKDPVKRTFNSTGGRVGYKSGTIGKPLDLTPEQKKRIEKLLDPVKDSKSFKDKIKEKVIETGKKVVQFTPPGQIKKLVDFVKDKTKKKTGIDVNKGDQKDIKVNTGNNNSSAGSSNPRRAGAKFGGRMGYKSGSKGCKLAMKGKGRAYGKNS